MQTKPELMAIANDDEQVDGPEEFIRWLDTQLNRTTRLTLALMFAGAIALVGAFLGGVAVGRHQMVQVQSLPSPAFVPPPPTK